MWLIRHRMSWVVKTLIVLSYPVQLLAYWEEAWKDIRSQIASINYEEKK